MLKDVQRRVRGSVRTVFGLQKKSCVEKWQSRPQAEQLCGVIRHAERADGVGTLVDGEMWCRTKDFLQWPLDPPLSDDGVAASHGLARQVQRFCEDGGNSIHVVVTSPYRRCVQTAVALCRELGRGTQLLVDLSLGEVFGPEVMGQVEPTTPVRPMDHTRAYCREMGVRCQPRAIGTWPRWPEDVRQGRRRFAARFLTYLNRGNTARRNFMIVTHGDCVGASLTMMPSQVGAVVQRVEFGGMFLARRQQHLARHRRPSAPTITSVSSVMKSIVPASTIGDFDEMQEEDDISDTEILSPGLWRPKGSVALAKKPLKQNSWMFDIGSVSSCEDPEGVDLRTPTAFDGWQVQTHDLTLAKINGVNENKAVSKRVRSLAKHSDFDTVQIERLLGVLSEHSLGHGDSGLGTDFRLQERVSGTQTSIPNTSATQCSLSTYLFGTSDVGCLSDVGSSAADSRMPTMSSLDGVTASSRVPTVNSLDELTEQARVSGRHLSRQSRLMSIDGVISPRRQFLELIQESQSSLSLADLEQPSDSRREAPAMSVGSLGEEARLSVRELSEPSSPENPLGSAMPVPAQAPFRGRDGSSLLTRRRGPMLGLSLPGGSAPVGGLAPLAPLANLPSRLPTLADTGNAGVHEAAGPMQGSSLYQRRLAGQIATVAAVS